MSNNFTILAIEDSIPDFELLKQALQQVEHINLNIIHITDGQKALDFISETKFNGISPPNMIILDINLPVINGYTILEKIKTDHTYNIIPLIIYSSSQDKSDILTSYPLLNNTHICKTFDIKQLFTMISNLGNFWFKTSKLPKNER